MENKNKVTRIENAQVDIFEGVSKKGNPYKAIDITVNGEKIRVGFVDAYKELALVRAGVIRYE